MNRFKSCFKNHSTEWARGILVLTIVFAGMTLMVRLITLFFDSEVGQINGIDSVAIIFAFVTGIVLFPVNLKLSMANGVSRKTEFLSIITSGLCASVVLFIISSIFTLLMDLIVPTQTMFLELFVDFRFDNDFQKGMLSIVNPILNIFCMHIIGYFVGSLYYRMNRVLKLIVSIGVPVMAFVGFPVALVLLPIAIAEKLISFLVPIFDVCINNPIWNTVLVVASALVFGFFAFLLIRKAPLKTN